MYVPVNEDEVDFGENDFTDDDKNDEMVIDYKYLDDEELSKPQTKNNLKKEMV